MGAAGVRASDYGSGDLLFGATLPGAWIASYEVPAIDEPRAFLLQRLCPPLAAIRRPGLALCLSVVLIFAPVLVLAAVDPLYLLWSELRLREGLLVVL